MPYDANQFCIESYGTTYPLKQNGNTTFCMPYDSNQFCIGSYGTTYPLKQNGNTPFACHMMQINFVLDQIARLLA